MRLASLLALLIFASGSAAADLIPSEYVTDTAIAPGYKPRMFDLWLADDPILQQRRKDGLPELWFETAPGRVVVRPVTRDEKGTWHATRDLEMLRPSTAYATRRHVVTKKIKVENCDDPNVQPHCHTILGYGKVNYI